MSIRSQDEAESASKAGRLKRDVGLAWLLSVILHICGVLAALFITFLDPEHLDPEIEITLQTLEEQKDEVRSGETTETVQHSAASPARPLPVRTETEPVEEITAAIAELPHEPVDSAKTVTFSLPDDVLKKDWTPEEAYGILSDLLEKYPQFRDMAMREMVAGHGYAPDTVRPIKLYLDQMLAGNYSPSWAKQRHTIERAFQSYNGVSGWSQNSNYGGGVNILGLIDFLIGLIKGDN